MAEAAVNEPEGVGNLPSYQTIRKLIPSDSINILRPDDDLTRHILSASLCCWKCLELCVDACQTPCGCRVCKPCLDEALATEQPACPVTTCRTTGPDFRSHCHPDNVFRKRFESDYLFQCPHRRDGCKDKVSIRTYNAHMQNCQLRPMLCNFCNDCCPWQLFQRHQRDECPRRPIKCTVCNQDVPAEDLEGQQLHFDLTKTTCCSEFQNPCPFCRQGEFKRADMELHIQECDANPRACFCRDIGCDFFHGALIVQEHEETEIVQHQKLLVRDAQKRKKFEADLKELQLLHEASQSSESMAMTSTLTMSTSRQFIWTVREVSKKVENGENLLTSPNFYTKPNGYKLRMHLYLQGHQEGMGTHISLYTQLCRGQHDNCLTWPFQPKLWCGLIKIQQARALDANSGFIFSLRDGVRSPGSFVQPKQNENPQYGKDTFITKNEAFSDIYTQDDRMYVRAILID